MKLNNVLIRDIQVVCLHCCSYKTTLIKRNNDAFYREIKIKDDIS